MLPPTQTAVLLEDIFIGTGAGSKIVSEIVSIQLFASVTVNK